MKLLSTRFFCASALSSASAAASVIAKVVRDRIMVNYERLFPGYGFAGHKGYGSAAHLQAIADAVWNSKRIRMRYRSWKAEKNRVAEPLGIVMKGGAWYLVARVDDTLRTYRISRVLDLIVTEERFDWPRDFDLAEYLRHRQNQR